MLFSLDTYFHNNSCLVIICLLYRALFDLTRTKSPQLRAFSLKSYMFENQPINAALNRLICLKAATYTL
ncbi:hypothetical protein A5320_03290 [Rheinheimera sp. SA_1]|nr:hypothetical protein A5320_03290 [Rheinheimera sp. SA_1]